MNNYESVKHIAKYVPVDDLTPLENNPRTISKSQFDKLKKSVNERRAYFEGRPCLVNSKDGKLIVFAGNQRLKAAQALKMDKVPCVIYENLSKREEKELTVLDNGNYGEWDLDILANDFSDLNFDDLGADVPSIDITADDMIEKAGDSYQTEMDDSTDYDEKKFVRYEVSEDIVERIKKGEIRPALAEVLERRIQQSVVFNFDELAKYYRSKDATEEERQLMRELYLVVTRPKTLIEQNIIELDAATSEIYTHLLGGGE